MKTQGRKCLEKGREREMRGTDKDEVCWKKVLKKYEGNKRKKEREKVSPQKRGEREREDK